MDKRKAKTLWVKSGTGSDTVRLTIPVSWIRDMGVNKEERSVILEYDREDKKIIIKKHENFEDKNK